MDKSPIRFYFLLPQVRNVEHSTQKVEFPAKCPFRTLINQKKMLLENGRVCVSTGYLKNEIPGNIQGMRQQGLKL